MAVEIRLLGPPSITRAGAEVRVPGRKPWALLAMLVLEPDGVSRRDLIGRLTPEANDPGAALRWLLHQVRRALEPEARIEEEQARLRLDHRDTVTIDAVRLLAAERDPDAVVADIRGELLEGIDFGDAPALDLWLSLERVRLHGVAAEALWWAATSIADADPERAMRIVRRGLDIDPYCETKHELMIDLHVRVGDVRAARRHAEAVERLYRADLGMDAPDWIRRPLARLAATGAGPRSGFGGAAETRALLRTAAARLTGGDAAIALDTARRGLDAAATLGDPSLEIAALLTLGRAITGTGRATAAEAKGLLTRAVRLARATGDPASTADALREIGVALHVEGNLGAAASALARATALAESRGDEVRVARAMTYRGVVASDLGAHDVARDALADAMERLERQGDLAWLGFAEAMWSRSLGRVGLHAEAIRYARRGGTRLDELGWVSVLPWAMLAEADAAVGLGDPTCAQARYAEVLALALEIGIPVYEGLALRGLAGLRSTTGDRIGAAQQLRTALAATRRFGDGHAWAAAAILTDLVELEGGRDHERVEDAVLAASGAPFGDLVDRLGPWLHQVRPQTRLQTTPA